jgi:hypothetical protein
MVAALSILLTVLGAASKPRTNLPSQQLTSVKMFGEWKLTVYAIDPSTGVIKQTVLDVDHTRGGCSAPYATPTVQMDSAGATVVDKSLFLLGQCQGVVNSTLAAAPLYNIIQVDGSRSTVLGSTPPIYKDFGNSVHGPTLSWDEQAKLLIIGDFNSNATGFDPNANRTVMYSTFDPATGKSTVVQAWPGLCPTCPNPKDTGYSPFAGTGAMGDGAVYFRPYLHFWGGKRTLPSPLLIGYDAFAGRIVSNLTLSANFYSMSRESSTGDLVGLGLCCSPKLTPGCPAVCGRPGSAPTYFENATCPSGCPSGSQCCRSPETPSKFGYCLDIPRNGTCGDLPATPGKPVFALLRASTRSDGSDGSGIHGSAPATLSIVKTYNSTELGGIWGSLASGGTLSADGVYSHAVVFGGSSSNALPTANATDAVSWHQSFLATDPNPGATGIVSINATTGDVLYVSRNVSTSVGAFLRYV